MAGIRVDTPIGPGWEYSLDQTNWQSSRIFTKAAGNVDFIIGNAYVIFCRNIPQNAVSQDVIIFGAQSNRVITLDDVAKAGISTQVGKTDQLLKLLGGLYLGNIPTTTDNLPHLVIDSDGKVWQKAAQQDVITYEFRGFEHYEFVPDQVATTPMIARVDTNNCDRITGWVYGGKARIERDGIVIAYIEPDIPREQALIDYLATQGITATTNVLGYAYYKSGETGTHTWRVFVENSTVEATTDTGAPTSITCGSTPTTPTPTNPPPVLANPIGNWTITTTGTHTKSITGAFTDNAGDTGTYNSLLFSLSFYAFVNIPAWLSQDANTGEYTAIIDYSVPNQIYQIWCWYTDSNGSAAYGKFNITIQTLQN